MELFGLKDKDGKEYSLIVPHTDDDDIRLTFAKPIKPIIDEPYVVGRCRRMGIKAGVRVKFADRQSHLITDDKWVYNETEDALFIDGVLIYYKGKWAKIVPDKPKELPKTIEELKTHKCSLQQTQIVLYNT